MRKKITFINEPDAAKMLNMNPRVLRRKCLKNLLPINYRNENGRKYQYVKEDIEEHQLKTSTIAA